MSVALIVAASFPRKTTFVSEILEHEVSKVTLADESVSSAVWQGKEAAWIGTMNEISEKKTRNASLGINCYLVA
jgi:ribosomal protein S4E